MRRSAVLLLSTVVVFGTLLAGGGLFAAAQDTDFAGHPLVGSWMLDTDIEDGRENLPFTGTVLSRRRLHRDRLRWFVAMGSWEPTGDMTAT